MAIVEIAGIGLCSMPVQVKDEPFMTKAMNELLDEYDHHKVTLPTGQQAIVVDTLTRVFPGPVASTLIGPDGKRRVQ